MMEASMPFAFPDSLAMDADEALGFLKRSVTSPKFSVKPSKQS